MAKNFIKNGVAHGDVANRLLEANFDVGCLRPYVGNDGRSYITKNDNGKAKAVPLLASNASLRKDDWKLLDEAIIKAAKAPLKAVADLRSKGLTFNIPNGMGTTVLQTQSMSDTNEAEVSMDGLKESENDRPDFDLTNLPLPIIHKDFSFSARNLQASRNGGSPLDTSMAEQAARKVSEQAEKLLLGVADSYAYGGGNIYGYTNFPSRITKTITDPTSSGWTPEDLLDEVLAMKQASQNAKHYGPWTLYVDDKWSQYLDNDYKASGGGNITLRDRLMRIEDIQDVKTVNHFDTDYDMTLVQMTTNVVREVIGMDVSTVQWETNGGMQMNFKVMGILVPQVRADYNSNTGIVHASV